MSEPLRIRCGNDTPTAMRLRELVTDNTHVVLHGVSEIRRLVERLATELPEFSVFDSGGTVTIKKVVLAATVLASAAEFLAAMRHFRDTAARLARRLANKLDVASGRLLEDRWQRKVRWAERLWQLFGGSPQAGRLDREWFYCFHGVECCFRNRNTGQELEVILGLGEEFGALDPFFFSKFLKSTPGFAHLTRHILDDYHDACRILDVLKEEGHLREVRGQWKGGLVLYEQESCPP